MRDQMCFSMFCNATPSELTLPKPKSLPVYRICCTSDLTFIFLFININSFFAFLFLETGFQGLPGN